jgi:hypothetical protein
MGSYLSCCGNDKVDEAYVESIVNIDENLMS